MNVMLLTAGLGTRLQPYTSLRPKPAIPFMTVPLAVFSLSLVEDINIDHLIYNTHHLPEQVEALFKDLKWPCHKMVCSHEPEILGSGGGVRKAEICLVGDGQFFVMNGDEVILPNQSGLAEEMSSFHRWHGGIATLLTQNNPEVGTKYGGAWCEGDQVKAFSKSPVAGLIGKHFLGVMILSDRIFHYCNGPIKHENILYDILTKAMSKGEKVLSYDCDAQWFETGNPQDFVKASELCLEAIARQPRPAWAEYLLQVVRLHSTHATLIEKDFASLASIDSQLRKFC